MKAKMKKMRCSANRTDRLDDGTVLSPEMKIDHDDVEGLFTYLLEGMNWERTGKIIGEASHQDDEEEALS